MRREAQWKEGGGGRRMEGEGREVRLGRGRRGRVVGSTVQEREEGGANASRVTLLL